MSEHSEDNPEHSEDNPGHSEDNPEEMLLPSLAALNCPFTPKTP
jgi:hypothetical protein